MIVCVAVYVRASVGSDEKDDQNVAVYLCIINRRFLFYFIFSLNTVHIC